MAISKKQKAMTPESQAAVEEYERSEAKLKPLREAKTRDVGAQFLPEDEEFEIQEPAVAQAGPTVAQAAEEEAELESGQYKIPAMSKAAAKVAMQKRLSGEQEARLMRDLEDLPEPEAKAEVSREQTFRGAGNYTYAKTADGDWFFTSPSGKTGVAKKGSKAWQSITSESEGKGSLWGTEGFAGQAKPDEETWEKERLAAEKEWDEKQMAEAAKKEEGQEEKAPEEGAEEEVEVAPTKRAPAPKNIKGDFSLDSPPPAFSPAKISTFLDQNPELAKDPVQLGAFIANANYGDRQDAGRAFVDTIRAKAELNSLAMRGRENLTFDEGARYTQLRQAFNYPATMSDRVLGAATTGAAGFLAGLAAFGAGAIPGAIGGAAYGAYNPRPMLGAVSDEREIVAASPGTTQRGEVAEDFGALLEAEFASR